MFCLSWKQKYDKELFPFWGKNRFHFLSRVFDTNLKEKCLQDTMLTRFVNFWGTANISLYKPIIVLVCMNKNENLIRKKRNSITSASGYRTKHNFFRIIFPIWNQERNKKVSISWLEFDVHKKLVTTWRFLRIAEQRFNFSNMASFILDLLKCCLKMSIHALPYFLFIFSSCLLQMVLCQYLPCWGILQVKSK